MFDSRREMNERALDAVDLVIDFATLGEYGLEPVAAAAPTRPCEGRRRLGAPRSAGSWQAAIDRFATQS